MNDINWHDMSDEDIWDIINAYQHLNALIETELAFRVDRVRYVTNHWMHGPWLSTANEKVKRIAFIG